MRSVYVLAALVVVLIAIVVISRTGGFARRAGGGTAESPHWTAEEEALLRSQFPDAIASPSGLRSIIRTPGTGDVPPRGATATVEYEGRLLRDGTKFDSSYDRHQPLVFQVGVGRVIAGWDEALATMQRGERRTVIIPWWLAYGERGAPPRIPPRAALVFEIQLLDFH